VKNGAEPYRNETLGETTKAVQLAYLIEDHIHEYHFTLDDVDGELLREGLRPFD
jgi:hypothetical protein